MVDALLDERRDDIASDFAGEPSSSCRSPTLMTGSIFSSSAVSKISPMFMFPLYDAAPTALKK
jgi:hypothetical protein